VSPGVLRIAPWRGLKGWGSDSIAEGGFCCRFFGVGSPGEPEYFQPMTGENFRLLEVIIGALLFVAGYVLYAKLAGKTEGNAHRWRLLAMGLMMTGVFVASFRFFYQHALHNR